MGLDHTLDQPEILFGDDQCHAKGTSGLALAVDAMAGNEFLVRTDNLVADGPALTASFEFAHFCVLTTLT